MPFGPPSYAYALVAGNLVPWLQATWQPGNLVPVGTTLVTPDF